MTSFSSSSVHACPGCDAFFLRPRLRSANFFGVQDWSDGKPTFTFRQEPLVRCKACAALFWLDDIESVGIMPQTPRPIGRFTRTWLLWRGDPQGLLQDEEEWSQAMASWGKAQYIGSVNFDDVAYVLARSKGVRRDRLLWLRNRIWWGLNDRYRSRFDDSPLPDVPTWPEAAERANMEAILSMLQDGEVQPRDMIQQGELLRLLGRFDEAVGVLKAVPVDGYSEIRAVKIERLARSGDTQVRMLSHHVL
ncbi:hypothetical protein QPK31_24115 [Massilia sp. YIM B02769]|uniref:hypothetical protein n=1 Tax=Massilia sp. YIM B02769 TaxID=3050129 RepID=UPI0025B6A7E1|nr:hypothetical protein [Massilia sp. YIM B02769]MDN4061310.1 hypothetical protein [Massilia sp. YIM B02769]